MALPGEGDIPADLIDNSIANRRFSRSTRERDLILELGPEGASAPREALNEKAVKVIRFERKRPPRSTCLYRLQAGQRTLEIRNRWNVASRWECMVHTLFGGAVKPSVVNITLV